MLAVTRPVFDTFASPLLQHAEGIYKHFLGISDIVTDVLRRLRIHSVLCKLPAKACGNTGCSVRTLVHYITDGSFKIGSLAQLVGDAAGDAVCQVGTLTSPN